MTAERALQVVGLLGLLAVLVSDLTRVPFLVAQLTAVPPRIEPADAIVVLAHRLRPSGALSDESLRRVAQGIVLQRRGLAPLLILSGGPGGPPDEARIRATLAREFGVPEEAAHEVRGARNTREEVERILPLLRARGARKILLVTNTQHMGRAMALFARAGLEVLPASVEGGEPQPPLARRLMEEWLARVYYRLAGYL